MNLAFLKLTGRVKDREVAGIACKGYKHQREVVWYDLNWGDCVLSKQGTG